MPVTQIFQILATATGLKTPADEIDFSIRISDHRAATGRPPFHILLSKSNFPMSGRYSSLNGLAFIPAFLVLAIILMLGRPPVSNEPAKPQVLHPATSLRPAFPSVTEEVAAADSNEPVVRPAGKEKTTAAVTHRGEGPDSINHKELGKALSQARRRVTEIDAVARRSAENTDSSHFLQNPSQKLTARFGSGAVRLASSSSADSWKGTFRYQGASAGSRLEYVGTKLTYHHPDGVVEWFDNREDGIEHGFKLQDRPSENGSRTLQISTEGLVARQSGEGLVLSSEDGRDVLAYSGLKVWDATNRPLEAHLEAKPAGYQIIITDRDAVYPVSVDPLYTRATAKLGPIVTGDGDAADYFGHSVATDGQTLLVGASNDNVEGSAYFFSRINSEWVFQTKVTAPDAHARDEFGFSAAVQGNIAVIGAPGTSNEGAYVYEKSATGWAFVAKLTPAYPGTRGGYFGASVALDHGMILVGAGGYPNNSASGFGKGYVFFFGKTDGIWTRQATLEDPDGLNGDEFGHSVALDGSNAFIGKPGNGAGQVLVFTKQANGWNLTVRLNGAKAGDRFGSSVAADGSALVVGAAKADTAAGVDAGSAQVFRKSEDQWLPESILNHTGAVAGDGFGQSVAIEGNRILVGAPQASNTFGNASVYEKSGSTWIQKSVLAPYYSTPSGMSGWSVALSGDIALAGAYNSDSFPHWYAGIVHEYKRNGGSWEFSSVISSGDGRSNQMFGTTVDIDGNRVAIGMEKDVSPYGEDSGSVYLFTNVEGQWELEDILVDTDPNVVEQFGHSVDLQGDRLIVGTPDDVKMSTESWDISLYRYGSVTCFRRDPTGWTKEAKLRPAVPVRDDKFGNSISLDGDSLLVGAPMSSGPQIPPQTYSGAGYIFSRVSGTWAQQAMLTRSEFPMSLRLGGSVALKNGRAMLTAGGHSNAEGRFGCVYEFTIKSQNWSFSTKIMPSIWEGWEVFGTMVSLDNDCLVVGADNNYGTVKSAYVFRRTADTWTQEARLISPEPDPMGKFGFVVSVKGDLIMVSDWSDHKIWSGAYSGSVHLFRKIDGLWTRFQKITAPDATSGSYFGLAMATDGTSVVVGAPWENVANPITGDVADYRGSAYVFELGEAWTDLQVISSVDEDNEVTVPRQGKVFSYPWTTLVTGGSPPVKVTLQNRGTIPLGGISAFLGGTDADQFTLQAYQQPLPPVLPPGGEAIFHVYFHPTVIGEHKTASLTITNHEAAGNFTIGLEGLANGAPLGTGIQLITVAGRSATFFPEDLAKDPDGHTVTLRDNTTIYQGSSITASGNKLTITPTAGFVGNVDGCSYYVVDEHESYARIDTRIIVLPGSTISRSAPLAQLAPQTWGILLTGEAGTTYRVERSEDTKVWKTLGSATTDAAGELFFVDCLQTQAKGFYRMTR